MRTLLTLAAIAALSATPALAKPGGGHGNGGDDDRGGQEMRHGGDRDDYEHGDRRHDVQRNYGYHGSAYRNCPPGLAKRHNGCTPPGQARNWSRGSHLPYGYNSYTAYNRIPRAYIDRYSLNPNNRYIYRNNTIYQIDPRTSIIQQIFGGLIR